MINKKDIDKQIKIVDDALSQVQAINEAINQLDLARLDTTLLSLKCKLTTLIKE